MNARRRPSITYREFAMNDDTPADPSVYAMRDHWKQQAQEAWQKVAELRLALTNVLPYAIPTIGLPRESWPTDSVILVAEDVLKRTKP